MARRKSFEETHATIICQDCGESRVVRNQDKHLVVRCVSCQHVYRTNRRNELRRKQLEDY